VLGAETHECAKAIGKLIHGHFPPALVEHIVDDSQVLLPSPQVSTQNKA